MRLLAGLIMGLVITAAHADPKDRDTIAFINDRLEEDRYFSTYGYSIAMPSRCVVEIVPKGSSFRGQKKRRVALHVLDRGGVERLDRRYRSEGGAYEGTWIHLVGKLNKGKPRKGFPSTGDLDDKGFPKYDEEMLSYGIEFRFHDQDIARDVAQAFVTLAAECDPEELM